MVRQPSAPPRLSSAAGRIRLLANQSSSQPSKRLIALKIVAIAAGGFLSALVLWEIILRLSVETSQGISDHPALGKIDSPGLMIHTREGFNRTVLNDLGMRGPEPIPKQPGEYRILLLGDSFTRADEVSDGISFGDRLQAHFTADYEKTNRLHNDPSDQLLVTAGRSRQITEKVNVINAGKPSASPAGYLFAADFHKQTFVPDATVIQLTEHDFTMDMGSDASEFYLEKSEEATSGDRAYEIKQNEAFGSADPLAQKVIARVPGLDSLLTLSTLRIGGRNLSAALSPTPSPEDVETPISVAESARIQAEDAAMIDWTLQQLSQTFPNVVIVFIPAMNYQDAGPTSSVPRNADIEAKLTEAAAAQDIPFINMRQDFREHYAREGTHLKGFSNTLPGEGHLNSRGHQLVTRRLIEFFNQPNSPLRQS
ncbi:MAG: SGNH/GDSL hydrolase family protein [Phormidesmis sp.]